MARTPEQDAALSALVDVLDAAHDAEGLLQVGRIAPDRSGGARLRRLFGLGQTVSPPADTTRRTANALDTFATQLHSITAVLPDPALVEAAENSASWGSELWDRSRTHAEIYAEFSAVFHRLQDHHLHLRRGRDL